MASFYVTLHTSDDIGNFSVKLHDSLEFPPNEIWKVAVTEITLSDSLYNIQDDFIKIKKKRKNEFYKLELSDGVYRNYGDFFELFTTFKPKFLKYLSASKIRVFPSRPIEFSENLSQVLGLPKLNENNTDEILELTPNVQAQTKYISVLCNIIEERVAGTTMIPLLIPLVMEGKQILGGLLNVVPFPLEYIAVKPGIYRELHFKLERTDGVLTKFEKNFLLIKLKFIRL